MLTVWHIIWMNISMIIIYDGDKTNIYCNMMFCVIFVFLLQATQFLLILSPQLLLDRLDHWSYSATCATTATTVTIAYPSMFGIDNVGVAMNDDIHCWDRVRCHIIWQHSEDVLLHVGRRTGVPQLLINLRCCTTYYHQQLWGQQREVLTYNDWWIIIASVRFGKTVDMSPCCRWKLYFSF